jgi:hypothetical protein
MLNPWAKRLLIGGLIFVSITLAVKLGIEWAFYMPPSPDMTTTTVTTQSTTPAEMTDIMDSTFPEQGTDPYDIYFYPTPCSTSNPYSHSILEIKAKQSNSDIAELKRRAAELAENDYYKQNRLFKQAFSQYAAAKSIEAITEQGEEVNQLLKVYGIDQETLGSIIKISQEKCPNDFVGQLDEIGLQMDAYVGVD